MSVLTDVVLSTDFLQDVDLLHRRLPDLLGFLRWHLVWGGDVDDLHRIVLRRPLVDTATHNTAHSPEEETTRWPCYLQICQVTRAFRGLCLHSWTLGKHLCVPQSGLRQQTDDSFCDNSWMYCVFHHTFGQWFPTEYYSNPQIKDCETKSISGDNEAETKWTRLWGQPSHVKNTRAAERIVHIRWPCDLYASEITQSQQRAVRSRAALNTKPLSKTLWSWWMQPPPTVCAYVTAPPSDRWWGMNEN